LEAGEVKSKNPFFLSFFQYKINLDKVWQQADFLIVSNQHVKNSGPFGNDHAAVN